MTKQLELDIHSFQELWFFVKKKKKKIMYFSLLLLPRESIEIFSIIWHDEKHFGFSFVDYHF
jgi:hypothetical protein